MTNDLEADQDLPSPRSSAMRLVREPTAPWFGAALLLALIDLGLVVGGVELSGAERSTFLIGICGAVGGGGLVSVRTSRALRLAHSEHRARPAADELGHALREATSASYIDGMEQWTGVMLELVTHALTATAAGSPAAAELELAAAETQDLRDLLRGDGTTELTINDRAMMHALGSLWEAGQGRVEHLAAAADSRWYRRWRSRSVVERRLRHGTALPESLVLPYTS